MKNFFSLKIAYILFLTLFTYVLLCDFFPISTNQYVTERFSLSIALPEVLLHIWVISSSIDFIFRQARFIFLLNLVLKYNFIIFEVFCDRLEIIQSET